MHNQLTEFELKDELCKIEKLITQALEAILNNLVLDQVKE